MDPLCLKQIELVLPILTLKLPTRKNLVVILYLRNAYRKYDTNFYQSPLISKKI